MNQRVAFMAHRLLFLKNVYALQR